MFCCRWAVGRQKFVQYICMLCPGRFILVESVAWSNLLKIIIYFRSYFQIISPLTQPSKRFQVMYFEVCHFLQKSAKTVITILWKCSWMLFWGEFFWVHCRCTYTPRLRPDLKAKRTIRACNQTNQDVVSYTLANSRLLPFVYSINPSLGHGIFMGQIYTE